MPPELELVELELPEVDAVPAPVLDDAPTLEPVALALLVLVDALALLEEETVLTELVPLDDEPVAKVPVPLLALEALEPDDAVLSVPLLEELAALEPLKVPAVPDADGPVVLAAVDAPADPVALELELWDAPKQPVSAATSTTTSRTGL